MSTLNNTQAEGAKTNGKLRRSLRYVLTAWGFGAVWMYITMGAAQTVYGKALGLSPFGFGVLAAVPFAGALFQIPGSYLIERYGRRKLFFMSLGIAGRSIWIFMAAIPWVVPERWWSIALLGSMAVAMLVLQMTGPAWLTWAVEWIPARIRGRYFSRRIQLGQATGLLVTLAVGIGMDYADRFDPVTLRSSISLAYIVAAVFGIIDYLWHIPVKGKPEKSNPQASLWSLVRQPLTDRNFLHFLGFTASMTFALGYVGQFANLYLLEVVTQHVKMKFLVINVMLVSIPLLVSMLSLPLWGRLIDRFGRKPILVIVGIVIINGGTWWIFITPEHWWFGYGLVLMTTFVWPGMDLANFNILLGMSESHGGKRAGSAYVAVNAAAVAIAGTLSGLFGGAVAEWLGPDWRAVVFGWTITYHGVLFLISAGLRGLSLLWLIGLKDEKAHSTRDAFRYMTSNMYSNLQQFLFMPGRVFGVVGRLTYKLNPKKPEARSRK